MAHPLLFIGGALGSLFVLKHLVDKKKEADEAREKAYGQMAKELEQGKSYTIQLMVDPRSPQWGGVTDLVTGEQLIKATFEQLGWKVLSYPKIRSDAEAKKFYAGQPCEWVFNGTWTKADKFMTGTPSWVGMAIPYLLPVM